MPNALEQSPSAFLPRRRNTGEARLPPRGILCLHRKETADDNFLFLNKQNAREYKIRYFKEDVGYVI
jgi:hypothetical protein